MLQNWVGNGIGWGFDPLTLSKDNSVIFVIFWKQDGNSSSSFFKDQNDWLNSKAEQKPWKVNLVKQRETKLDRLEKL